MTDWLARVTCTIITGFLGVGKTTLIRHVLGHAQGRRLAVIVNEYVDVGSDGASVAEGQVAADMESLARERAADPSLGHDDPVEEVFADQVACADLVVLNKRDLLDAASLDRALATVAGRLPRAVRIVAISEGKIDPAALLGLGVGTEDDIANRRTRHDEEPDHDHDDFDSFVVPLPEVADPAALAKRVAGLADTHNVFRVKGFAAVAGKPMRLLLQAVGARVSHQYDRAWTASDE